MSAVPQSRTWPAEGITRVPYWVYLHAIDDDRLEDWPGFFVEKGRYRITTAENFERGQPLSIRCWRFRFELPE